MDVNGGFLQWGYSQIMHFNRIFHSTQRGSSQELGFLLGSSHLMGTNGIIRVVSLLARVITYNLLTKWDEPASTVYKSTIDI